VVINRAETLFGCVSALTARLGTLYPSAITGGNIGFEVVLQTAPDLLLAFLQGRILTALTVPSNVNAAACVLTSRIIGYRSLHKGCRQKQLMD